MAPCQVWAGVPAIGRVIPCGFSSHPPAAASQKTAVSPLSLVLHSCMLHGNFWPTSFANRAFGEPEELRETKPSWSIDIKLDLEHMDGDPDTELPQHLKRVRPSLPAGKLSSASLMDIAAAW